MNEFLEVDDNLRNLDNVKKIVLKQLLDDDVISKGQFDEYCNGWGINMHWNLQEKFRLYRYCKVEVI